LRFTLIAQNDLGITKQDIFIKFKLFSKFAEDDQERSTPIIAEDFKDNQGRSNSLIMLLWTMLGITALTIISNLFHLEILYKGNEGLLSESEAETSDLYQAL